MRVVGGVRRWLLIGALVTSCLPGAAWASVEVDLLLDKLVQKGVLTREEAADLRSEMAEFKETSNKQLAKEIVPKWAQSISMSGDLRLRHESFWRDTTTTNPDQHRERLRLRLGIKSKVSDQLEAGVRLATGSSLDPVSTNQTFTSIFDKKNIFLDQAYLKLVTTGTPFEQLPITLWGGKFESPFYATPLVWDGDLTFEVMAVTVAPKLGPADLFVSGGIFPVNEITANAEDPVLYAVQGGITWSVAPTAEGEFLKNLKLKTALGYYDYTQLNSSGIPTSSSNRFGNTARSSSTATNTIFQYDFDEVDIPVELTSQVLGRPVKLYADFVKNTATTENDKGWQLGAKYGSADRPGAWEAGYYWQRLEPDAVLGQFTDSDFGSGGTGRQGHVYYGSIGTLKNSTLGFKWFVTEAIRGGDNSVDRLQVDWMTKF